MNVSSTFLFGTWRSSDRIGSSFSTVTGFGIVPSIRRPCTSASMPAVSRTRSSSTLMIATADSRPRAPKERIVSIPSRSGIRRAQRIRSNHAPGSVTAASASRPSSASVTVVMLSEPSTWRTHVRTCNWSSMTRTRSSELSSGIVLVRAPRGVALSLGIQNLPHLVAQQFRSERLLDERDALFQQIVQDDGVARIARGEQHLQRRPQGAHTLRQLAPAHSFRKHDVRQEEMQGFALILDHPQRLLA